MSDVDSTTPLKRCTKCGEWFPATPEYFHRDKTQKDGLYYNCKPCNRARALEWSRNNPERNRQRVRDWHADPVNKAHRRKVYAEKSADETVREQRREQRRKWRSANREKKREDNRRWALANPEKQRAAIKRWAKAHPDKRRAISINRRARLLAGGTVSDTDLAAIRAAQTDKRGRLRCWWCGKPIAGTPHLDHKIAVVKGGLNTAKNLCYACPRCNRSKGAKDMGEWAGRLV